MFSNIVGILLLIGFTVFAVYQIISIVKYFKTKKQNKKNILKKEDNE